MKRLYLTVLVLAALLLLPVSSAFAQASQAQITYPGDTKQTVARRAQWIKAAQKEGELHIWGSDSPSQANAIAAEFNKVYPFIKVVYWRGRDQERQVRFEAEHGIGRMSVDISDSGGPQNFPRWRKMGLVAPYKDYIPGIEKKDKRMYSKYGDWAQIGHNAIVPMYNSSMLTADEAPRSWEDLLDPKWKGHLGITTDMKAWYCLALEGGWGIEKTEDYLRKLKGQNPIWASGHSAGMTLLVAGEYKIFVENYLRFYFQYASKGAPIGWIKASPVPITGGFFFFVNNAPHPNAAKLYIEWLFSPQGAAFYEKLTGYGCAFPGSNTQLSKALHGLELAVRTEEVLLKVEDLGLIDRFSEALGVKK